MSVNKYNQHIWVLPEDDANRQIANGFLLAPNLNDRAIQTLPPSGGWIKVLNSFKDNHVPEMYKYKNRMMLLLVDFDLKVDRRLTYAKKQIPDDLKERVFVLGTQSEPENLKKNIANINTFEDIGKALAQDCVNETDKIWGHDLIKHNRNELARMISSVKPFLFN
ncbi:hypothetical protein [Candidatus Parabeggiatoa sp. HSG14]|uniref:hypothetical protein n=1 Tax=Candidatus Parabeggiatoa sp. HSG14 TaxID=3055593 RepID=UPI0025A8F4B5|nr:hypothetical protein [Thiotrichales bacterium HSG14]